MVKKVAEAQEPKDHITVFGKWKIFRPDTRQYKQQSIEVELDLDVAVDVPLQYVFHRVDPNASPTLNLEGMKYVQDQFEKLYLEKLEKGVAWEEHTANTVKTSEDGWGEEETTTEPTKESTKVTDDSSWGDDPVFVDDAEDDKDTPNNKPDTETWDETKEDWE